MPVTPPQPLISKFAEESRILPTNTPFPGLWNNSKTPYLVEVMDNMSHHSPIQHTVVMKGVQGGWTTAAENVIGYYMKEKPAEILYITATTDLLEKWANNRLEPLIDSCGIRSRLSAQIDNPKSRRTGDKILSKTFSGGHLNMTSAQSASGLRSESIRILIRDEIDGAPPMLVTGEGDWIAVSEARTTAWGGRRKIYDLSTPKLLDKSRINELYEAGDKRKYLVPCPFCRKDQELRFGNDRSQYGIKADTKAGVLQFAYYQCDYCHEAIRNHHKTQMLREGQWHPSSKSCEPDYRSYHWSTLLSPVGMQSWSGLWREYLRALAKPDGMRSFVNLYLGLPYKESGSRPKLENVIMLRGGYKQGTVQDGVLYLTAGIDVQSGSKTDKNNPARLEMEVMGIGAGYRSWSIMYHRFEGPVDDPYSGAWELLQEFANDGGLIFKRSDGREFKVGLLFIDSGDGNLTDVVYRFADRWENTFPSKGFGSLKRRKGEKGDEASPSNFKRYRPVQINPDTVLYEMSTNFYKTQLYNSLKVPRVPTDPQKPGFTDFPVDYPETYFQMLTAEEKRGDGSFHNPSGRRNEALDCRVMCMCGAHVWLDNKLLEFRVNMKEQGVKAADLMAISHRTIIEILTKQTSLK